MLCWKLNNKERKWKWTVITYQTTSREKFSLHSCRHSWRLVACPTAACPPRIEVLIMAIYDPFYPLNRRGCSYQTKASAKTGTDFFLSRWSLCTRGHYQPGPQLNQSGRSNTARGEALLRGRPAWSPRGLPESQWQENRRCFLYMDSEEVLTSSLVSLRYYF